MMGGPTHAGPLQASLDDLLVGTFHRAGTNGVATALEVWIVNHLKAMLQVGLRALEHYGLLFSFGFRLQQS